MNRLYLTFKRIQEYFVTNKTVFVMYCVGVILTVFAMIIVYTGLISYYKYNDQSGYFIYDLSSSDGGTAFSVEEGKKLMSSFQPESAESVWRGMLREENAGRLITDNSGIDTDKTVYVTLLSDNSYFDYGTGKLTLDAGEIVLPRELLIGGEAIPVGASVTVFGKAYTVKAFHDNLVPYVMFREDDEAAAGGGYTSVRFAFKKMLGTDDLLTLKKAGASVFGEPSVDALNAVNSDYRDKLLKNLIYLAGLCAVAMLAFVFLFKYMLDCRSSENIVMSVCGASKKRITLMVLRDVFLLNTLSSVPALLLFELLRRPLFSQIMRSAVMLPEDYAIIYACFICVSLLVCVPFLSGYLNESLMKARNKYTT